MRGPVLLVAAALMGGAAARADVVQTARERLEGKAALAGETLQVAGKPVAWDDVLFVIRDQETRSIRPPQALRMTSGETWLAHVASLTAGKVKARFVLFGEREIDAALVGALDFLPDLAPPGPGDKPATLYREKGEPIPGTLLWVDEQRLAMDSPLGVVTLQRDGLARYLFRAVARPMAAKGDEVSLADGTTLRGQAKVAKDGLELDHPVLGRLAIPARALRSVLRHAASAAFLAEMAPAAVSAVPLVAKGAPPETLEYPTSGDSRAWPGELSALRAIRIQPKCSVRYRLPRLEGQKLVLAATFEPVEGMRGDARLRLVAAGKTLLERDIGPGTKREAVSLEVPRDAELAIEVDFGPAIRFPCGVVIGDPVVVGR